MPEHICGAVTYTAQQSTDGGSTYVALDSNIFTFTDSDPNVLSIDESDTSYEGLYSIKITGT